MQNTENDMKEKLSSGNNLVFYEDIIEKIDNKIDSLENKIIKTEIRIQKGISYIEKLEDILQHKSGASRDNFVEKIMRYTEVNQLLEDSRTKYEKLIQDYIKMKSDNHNNKINKMIAIDKQLSVIEEDVDDVNSNDVVRKIHKELSDDRSGNFKAAIMEQMADEYSMS
jgi:hypothetical protein